MSIRGTQPFPDPGAGVATFMFPARRTRYRVISVSFILTTNGVATQRTVEIVKRADDIVVAQFPCTGLAQPSIECRVTFSHLGQSYDRTTSGGLIMFLQGIIPFDLIIEPQNSLSVEVIDMQTADAISALVIEWEEPNPKGKPIAGTTDDLG